MAGLGFGANQLYFTAISLTIVCIILIVRCKKRNKISKSFDQTTDINVIFTWPSSNSSITVNSIVNDMSDYCSRISLLRFNSNKTENTLLIQANLFDETSINSMILLLNAKDERLTLTINNSNIDW